MQPRKDEGKHRMATNRLSPTILWQQQQQLKVVAAASLPICWDESLAERETADKEELVRLLSAPHRLETKSGLRRQSTCIKGIKVHVHLFVGTQDTALLCNIMGVMQGLEANQLHWIAMS